MSEQSLRDALEKLAGELEYDVAGAPAKIRALLAAEPAPDRQPSHAAVEAAKSALRDNLWVTRHFWVDEFDCEVSEDSPEAVNREMSTYQDWSVGARAAVEAAYRVDAPRPAIEREALVEMLWDYPHPAIKNRQTCEMEADQILKLARPMPTRDDLTALFDRLDASGWDPDRVRDAQRKLHGSDLADAVLALLNGSTS